MNAKNSTKQQQSCRLVEFLMFNSAFGRHRSLINTKYTFIISPPRSKLLYSQWGSNRRYPDIPQGGVGRGFNFGSRQYSVGLYFLCQPSIYTSFRIFTFDSILSRILILQYSARNLIAFCSHQYNYTRTYSFILL